MSNAVSTSNFDTYLTKLAVSSENGLLHCVAICEKVLKFNRFYGIIMMIVKVSP